MKCKSEDILSDSLTKVMTMPKHHVQRCGLKDLQIMMVTVTTETQCEHPPPVRCGCMVSGRQTCDVSITWSDPPRCHACLYQREGVCGCDCFNCMPDEVVNHTKVMTTPKHRVQRGGSKDIQIMMVTAMVMQCGLGEAKSAEDKYPGSEWFVLQAAAIVFMVGLFTGIYLYKKIASWWTPPLKTPLLATVGTQTTAIEVQVQTEVVTRIPPIVYVAPASGRRFHLVRSCQGMNQAGERKPMEPCAYRA
jgi:hypothetical protein